MDVAAWLTTALGIALSLLALVDVFLTVLHPDVDGPVAGRVQLVVWKLFLAGERHRPGGRRLMALAGPSMLVLTFAAWLILLILGVALIAWPFVDSSYRAEADLGVLGFDDALYYSGTTVAVLGHGDITPLTPAAQLLAVMASLGGFALLTGVVAYLIEVLSSVGDRVRMAVRIRADIAGNFDGAALLARWTAEEELGDVRDRLETWADLVRDAQDQLQRYPLAALCIRSSDADQDPEPAVRAAAEVAMAARLLGADLRFKRLRHSAGSLDHAVTRYIVITGKQYLGADVARRLDLAEPQAEDHRYVEELDRRLCTHFGTAPVTEGIGPVVDLAHRSRLYLESFHHLTSAESLDLGSTSAPTSADR